MGTVKRLDTEEIQVFAAQLRGRCEVMANLVLHRHGSYFSDLAEGVLSILKRGPCTLDDICAELG